MIIKIGKGIRGKTGFGCPYGDIRIGMERMTGKIDFNKLGRHLAKNLKIEHGEIEFTELKFVIRERK